MIALGPKTQGIIAVRRTGRAAAPDGDCQARPNPLGCGQMGRIDDALLSLDSIEDTTERALQLAGLISTLFKLRGITLVVTGQMAFGSYANAVSDKPELELAIFSGDRVPRIELDILRGQLRAKGTFDHWKVAGIPVQLLGAATIARRDLCRDFMTDLGIVKLVPAEEITADCILASIYPDTNAEAQTRARLLLINGLSEAFKMDWTALQTLCDRSDYRVGEELARMRQAAKKDVDAIGGVADPLGMPLAPVEESTAEKPKPKRNREMDDLSSLY